MPSLRNGRPAAPDAACSRQAFTKGGEVAAEISTPSVARPASCSMLGREAASTIGTSRAPLARRRPETWKTSPWKSVISPASRERQIAIASASVLSGRGDSMPAALRSAGAPTPRQRMTRPGYISSRLAAAMAMNTGCIE